LTPRPLWAAAAVLTMGIHAAYAQQVQPYTGEQARAIKSLSDDEIKQYLSGAGMGYARAAELNRFPGPMHVLELGDELSLTAQQRLQTETLMTAHKAEARRLGGKVVEAERALDALFRAERVAGNELARHVRAVAEAQGEYRLSHLETHRHMRDLLAPEQIARYDELRGYGAPVAGPARSHKH
jgi:Spy/CpxP family protein refolding chaperone